MVTEKLIIDGVTIPIDKGIATVLTFSIKDIQQPDKVKSSYSKTIKLPGSKAINDKLNFVFEVNTDSTFNPNLKLDAVYYQNDIAVFSGFIQLKDIIKKDYNQVEYSVVLFGETANIFGKLGNKFLKDVGMNWNELDHDYTQVNQESSWNTNYQLNSVTTPFAYGSGYTYPMINYGNDTDISVYNVDEMFPAVYAKEYIDRMFADAGYTYTSTFFDSSIFKHLVIPFNGKEFNQTQTALSPREVKANTPLTGVGGARDYISLDSSVYSWTDYQSYPIKLSVESVDANNQYDPLTGIITIGATGFYRVSFDVLIQMETTPKAGAAAAGDVIGNLNPIFVNNFGIRVNGVHANAVSSFTTADNLTPTVAYQTASPTTYPDSDFKQGNSIDTRNYNPPNRYQVSADVQLSAGDEVNINLSSNWSFTSSSSWATPPAGWDYPYYDSVSGDPYHADFKMTMLDANIALNVLDAPYAEGDSIDMFTAIPSNIKQRDFLTSIIKMFNLYMLPDVDNPKNMIVETREDFYTTDIIDWSSKLDYSKVMNLTPTSVTNKQRYIYTYKKDSDFYNKKYINAWQDLYGTRTIYLDNEFNKTDHKTEVIFSSTPLVGQLTSDRVISTIVDLDDDLQQKTIKSNIRILYYGGLKPSIVNWNHEAIAGNVIQSTYPYAGHFSDPYSPSLDINFGLPREIYYDSTWGDITVTDVNLYNTYHRKELEQLTDKDSKIFKGYFLLNPTDIANLSFRKSYWFENGYWTLHKVVYGSSVYQPSQCEFLKLKNIPTPPTNGVVLKGGRGLIGDEDLPFMYKETLSGGNVLSTKSNTVSGLNNFIDKTAMFVDIVGDNNKVATGSKNISISGDNNVIESGLKNITLTNTSNKTITESDVSYINGVQDTTGGVIGGVVVTINSNTTADESVSTYLCDTSGGGFAVSLPSNPTIGKVWNFKKIDIKNTLQLRATAPVLIDELSTKNITGLNNSFSIQFDGTNYKII